MGNALIEVQGLTNNQSKTIDDGNFSLNNMETPLQPNNIEASRVYTVDIEFKQPQAPSCIGNCNLRAGMLLGPLESITLE